MERFKTTTYFRFRCNEFPNDSLDRVVCTLVAVMLNEVLKDRNGITAFRYLANDERTVSLAAATADQFLRVFCWQRFEGQLGSDSDVFGLGARPTAGRFNDDAVCVGNVGFVESARVGVRPWLGTRRVGGHFRIGGRFWRLTGRSDRHRPGYTLNRCAVMPGLARYAALAPAQLQQAADVSSSVTLNSFMTALSRRSACPDRGQLAVVHFQVATDLRYIFNWPRLVHFVAPRGIARPALRRWRFLPRGDRYLQVSFPYTDMLQLR